VAYLSKTADDVKAVAAYAANPTKGGAATAAAPAQAPSSSPAPAAAAPAPAAAAAVGAGGRVSISPFARKLAAEKGIDINSIVGTGPGGVISADDVSKAAAGGGGAPAAVPAAAKAAPSGFVSELKVQLRTQAGAVNTLWRTHISDLS
jgi:pyruvate dehydrogenase E2 component (dihydrolipoamide acetyltransferase)